MGGRKRRKFNFLSLEGRLGIYHKTQEIRKAIPLAKGIKTVVTKKARHISWTWVRIGYHLKR